MSNRSQTLTAIAQIISDELDVFYPAITSDLAGAIDRYYAGICDRLGSVAELGKTPTAQDLRDIEQCALGHSDYVKQFTLAIERWAL